jgi:predicted TIM-barrel fold metal-dependent hydrolase
VIVDTQVHVYAADTPERPWVHDVSYPDMPELTGDQMVAAMDAVGVDRAIMVSPWTMYATDTSYAESQFKQHPDRFRLVAPIDPRDDDVADQVASWAARPGAAGLRVLFMPGGTTWSADHAGLRSALHAAIEAGLPVNLFCWGHLPVADELARAFPDIQFVLDHLGLAQSNPLLSPTDALADLDQVLALARNPNVAIKLTGMCTYSAEGFPFSDLWDPMARVFDAFGVERCLWGTDWQRSTAIYRYEDAVVAFRDRWPLGESERAAIMGGNALRVYRWDERG